MSEKIRVTVSVDTDELRRWADHHADAGHHGVAHVLYKAASDGESLSEQAIREARAEEARAANERQRLSLDTTLNRLIADELDAGHTERAASLRSLRAWNRGAAYVIPRGAR